MWQVRRDSCTTTRPWFFVCAWLLLIMAGKVCSSNGGNTLSPGQSLSSKSSEVLVSNNNIFELGFFTTGKPDPNMYLGIWYKDGPSHITVWIANRNNPLLNFPDSKLGISQDGNLVLITESQTIRLTNLALTMSNYVEAVLLDDGNFVLRNSSKPSAIFWQSFDYPTDTWLPGAKLGNNTILTSWKNSDDPSPGLFSVRIDPSGLKQYIMEWNMSKKYWSSGEWNNSMFSMITEVSYMYEFRFNENETYFSYSVFNPKMISRLVINVSGQLQQNVFSPGNHNWGIMLSQPKKQSEVYAFCGPYGMFNDNPYRMFNKNPYEMFNENSSAFCKCLTGFQQLFSTEQIRLNDWQDGCVRKTHLKCEDSASPKGKKDDFKKIPNVNLPANSKAYPAQSIRKCKLACMQNCSCIAYMYKNNECLVWNNNTLLDLKELSHDDKNREDLYLKLAGSEFQGGGGKRMVWWVVTAVLVSLVLLVSGGFLCRFWMRKPKQTGVKDLSKDLLSYDFNSSSNATEDERNRNNLTIGENKDVELPLFCFASVSAATGNFSEDNKLGQGGFGPVFKGRSLGGQEVAVKRLSKRSGQGLEEFRNEIVLISKLQHRNLVRLLGCCIEQDENILIYEYMPNMSLDFFLFDPDKQELLDWNTRRRIIEGIAQGILYLHQYSRLRIIHRDLKASNILLDSEMNPKISDFGMARIFGGNDSQANTKRIVGTFGYMAPEYALEGHFSIKTDVFSFGVLLLEIVSGKKNTGFYNTDSLNLLGHAWKLWNADRAVELMDPALGSPSSVSTLLRYINIGLICVQGKPEDRPSMSSIISMLSNDLIPLPIPKEPAFTTNHTVMKSNASSSSGGNFSVNGLTVSRIEPR